MQYFLSFLLYGSILSEFSIEKKPRLLWKLQLYIELKCELLFAFNDCNYLLVVAQGVVYELY